MAQIELCKLLAVVRVLFKYSRLPTMLGSVRLYKIPGTSRIIRIATLQGSKSHQPGRDPIATRPKVPYRIASGLFLIAVVYHLVLIFRLVGGLVIK